MSIRSTWVTVTTGCRQRLKVTMVRAWPTCPFPSWPFWQVCQMLLLSTILTPTLSRLRRDETPSFRKCIRLAVLIRRPTTKLSLLMLLTAWFLRPRRLAMTPILITISSRWLSRSQTRPTRMSTAPASRSTPMWIPKPNNNSIISLTLTTTSPTLTTRCRWLLRLLMLLMVMLWPKLEPVTRTKLFQWEPTKLF